MLLQRLTGIVLLLFTVSAIAADLPLHLIQLPPGFRISLYSHDVPNARSMSMSPGGTLFVGSRQAGKVYAVRDSNGDGVGDRVYTIASGLNMPNGVAFHNGALYVAEINRILRFDNIETRLSKPPQPETVSTDFPADKHHGWKFIRIGPDGKLYVPIGAPCNVCIEYGYAVITRLNLDGSHHEIYAEGVRNSVGFDWHPDTAELWFTDNGRDMLGDDLPPDELNRAPHEGMHFGFPYCHAGEVLDPEFGLGHRCKEYSAPVQKLGAHVAALGMRFYKGRMFPDSYHKQVFIAEHGSWNRSEKSGYRLSLVRHKGNKALSYEAFATGWLQGQEAWGRPVDIEHMTDGSLLVSDDLAGAIYRIDYDPRRRAAKATSQASRLKDNSPLPETPSVSETNSVQIPSPAVSPVHQVESGQQVGGDLPEQPAQAPLQTPLPVVQPLEQTPLSQPVQDNEAQPHIESPRDIVEKRAREVQAREKLHQAAKEIESQSGQTAAHDNRPSIDGNAPPVELIERIHERNVQNQPAIADPFSPVKKQTVDQ